MTNSEELIKRLEHRDRVLRAAEMAMVGIVAAIVLFIAIVSFQTQQNIADNQRNNIIRLEKSNDQMKDYISCILLIPIANRGKAAYDQCALQTGSVSRATIAP